MLRFLIILFSPFWVPVALLILTAILLIVASLIFVVALGLLVSLIYVARSLMTVEMWITKLRNDVLSDIAAQVSAEQEKSTIWRFGRVVLRRIWRNLHADL